MFASIELARRIDGAETRLTESVVRALIGANPSSRAFVEPICGGVAAYAGRSSPMSKMIGVGLRGTPSETELQRVEDAFRARGAPLQAEVATLAEPALALLLTKRGYVLQNFENVSGRRIVDDDRTPSDTGDVRIARMAATNAAEWIDVAITAFQHPDGEGGPAEALPQREVLEAALWPWTRIDDLRRYGAWVDGHLAGVATLRVDDGIAQLCGAATLPVFRRRGIQAALLGLAARDWQAVVQVDRVARSALARAMGERARPRGRLPALSALFNSGSREKVRTIGDRSEPRSPSPLNRELGDSRERTRLSAPHSPRQRV